MLALAIHRIIRETHSRSAHAHQRHTQAQGAMRRKRPWLGLRGVQGIIIHQPASSALVSLPLRLRRRIYVDPPTTCLSRFFDPFTHSTRPQRQEPFVVLRLSRAQAHRTPFLPPTKSFYQATSPPPSSRSLFRSSRTPAPTLSSRTIN